MQVTDNISEMKGLLAHFSILSSRLKGRGPDAAPPPVNCSAERHEHCVFTLEKYCAIKASTLILTKLNCIKCTKCGK